MKKPNYDDFLNDPNPKKAFREYQIKYASWKSKRLHDVHMANWKKKHPEQPKLLATTQGPTPSSKVGPSSLRPQRKISKVVRDSLLDNKLMWVGLGAIGLYGLYVWNKDKT
jgi:hypothetical protein